MTSVSVAIQESRHHQVARSLPKAFSDFPVGYASTFTIGLCPHFRHCVTGLDGLQTLHPAKFFKVLKNVLRHFVYQQPWERPGTVLRP